MWERASHETRRYGLDLREIATATRDGQWLRAAPVHALMGFAEAVRLVLEEGREHVWARHWHIAQIVRDALSGMGWTLAAPEGYAASTVTVAFVPGTCRERASYGAWNRSST